MNKLDNLRAQFEEIKGAVDEIHNRAVAEGRDLTDDENATADELMTRANALKPEIEKAVAAQKSMDDTAALLAKVNQRAYVAPAKESKTDAGEIATLKLRAILGDQEASQKVRALDVVSSSTSAGLLPYVIIGDTIAFFDAERRVIDSLNYQTIPDGKPFKRRVQSNGTTVVATQGSQNTEVASGYATVSYVDVTPATYAGGFRYTIQADAFTNPSALAVETKHLADNYALETDKAVAAAFKTAATNTATLAYSGATPQTVMTAIMGAADSVYSASKTEADTIWMSPTVKTWLACLVGSDGQFAFPMLAPNNRDGSINNATSLHSGLSIGGLRVVVSPNFASGTLIVGNSKWGEVYESMYGYLTSIDAPKLAKDIVLAGELATYFRAEGFIKLVDNGATPVFS